MADFTLLREHIDNLVSDDLNKRNTNWAAIETALNSNDNAINNPPLTFNSPVVNLADADDLQLARFNVPAGKSIKVLKAGIIQRDGTVGAIGLELQVYNNTDAVLVYSTTSDYQEGTYDAPLASGAEGDEVIIRLSNSTGAVKDCSGFANVVIE